MWTEVSGLTRFHCILCNIFCFALYFVRFISFVYLLMLFLGLMQCLSTCCSHCFSQGCHFIVGSIYIVFAFCTRPCVCLSLSKLLKIVHKESCIPKVGHCDIYFNQWPWLRKFCVQDIFHSVCDFIWYLRWNVTDQK